MSKRRRTRAVIARHPVLAVMLVASALAVAFGMSRAANATTGSCSNPATLAGSAFEIDVNANLKVDTTGCIDWLNDAGSALRTGVLTKQDKASGAGDDAFGQGTKEDDANPTIVDGSIPPNKSDLLRFGVFTETQGTAKFLELFWTRINSPQGTTNMDFELNQKFCDPSATPTNCANNGSGVTPETPIRTTGDKLITYDLAKGGTVPTISIRTWNGTAWGSPIVISGGQNAQALGSVNTTQILAADADAVGNPPNGTLDPFTFGEVAINFSAIFPPGGACGTFGSAYLKSRSSDSFPAELKDFISPEQVNITNCTGLTTTATGPVTIGASISDTAHLTGATANAGGTITFRAYSNTTCTTLVFTSAAIPVSGPGDYNSGPFTPTAVGTYYWIASYTGDLNNAPSATACGDANESSVVNKKQPSITTTLSASSITVGGSAHDSATLTGATADAGGTVTYTVYTDNACSQGARDAGTKTVTAGVVPDSNSLQFNTVGTFYWQAVYSGDAKNEGATSVCTTETLVVNKAQPGIVTQASGPVTIGTAIHDTATLSGGVSPTGSITFKAYSDLNCSTEVFSSTVPVNGNGNYGSGDFTPTAAGTYFWTASYSGDANNEAVATACGDANESSVVGKAPSSVDTAQKLRPQDSATVSAGAGGTPTGDVTFELFAPGDTTCTGPAVYTETVGLSGGSAATNNTTFDVSAANDGTYRWKVTYSGDASHDGSTSDCGVEQFTATITNS
jgi:hypothetical protein